MYQDHEFPYYTCGDTNTEGSRVAYRGGRLCDIRIHIGIFLKVVDELKNCLYEKTSKLFIENFIYFLMNLKKTGEDVFLQERTDLHGA